MDKNGRVNIVNGGKGAPGRDALKRMTLAAAFLMVGMIAVSGTAFAGSVNGDDVWNQVITIVATWIPRLGGLVIVIGGIMFGLGWKNDDAEGKARGVQTMVSGAIVTALVIVINMLLV